MNNLRWMNSMFGRRSNVQRLMGMIGNSRMFGNRRRGRTGMTISIMSLVAALGTAAFTAMRGRDNQTVENMAKKMKDAFAQDKQGFPQAAMAEFSKELTGAMNQGNNQNNSNQNNYNTQKNQ